MNQCTCGSRDFIGVEYHYDHPERYDGISEYRCTKCGIRYGRWSGKVLNDNEWENRYGRKDA